MKYYFLVLVFFVSVYLIPLGMRPMLTPDEFRYAAIPLEMMERSDYTVPRLAGCDYFEKPTLGYLLTAASFNVFGVNRFALRFPAAAAALIGAAFLMILVAQHTKDDRAAALAGLIYLSCGMVFILGTTAVLDSQLAAATGGMFCALFLASEEPKFDRRKFFLLACAGIAAGLSFWIKGLVGIGIVGAGMLGYLLWEKRYKDIFVLPWVPFAFALLTVLPWAVKLHHEAPDFWRYFIEEEHLRRFFRPDGGQHEEPFWFLWPILLGGLFPAGFCLFGAVGGMFGGGFFKLRIVRFSTAATLLPMVFLSCSGGKLPTYVLPCYFPLAILLTAGLVKYMRSGGSQKLFFVPLRVLGILLLSAGAAGCVLLSLPALCGKPLFPGESGVTLLAVILGLWGAMLLFFPARSWRWQMGGLFVGLVMFVQGALLVFPYRLLGCKMPEAALKRAEKEFDVKNERIVTTPSMAHAVFFTFGRRDILFTSGGEFTYGLSKKDQKHRLLGKEGFFKFLMKPDREDVLFICSRLDERDLPMEYRKLIKRHFSSDEIDFVLLGPPEAK